MRLLPVVTFLLLPLAGCLGADGAMERATLEPARTGPAEPWVLRTTGCGFCGDPRGPWADTLSLGRDGTAVWFSFRPDVTATGERPARPIEGVAMPRGLEHLRPSVEAAVRVLQDQDVYWAKDRGVQVHEASAWRVVGEDRERLVGFLEDRSRGLEGPPPIEDRGCQDCAMPVVQVVGAGGVVGGAVQREGANGPGTGNVAAGSGWWSLEQTMAHLHLQARA